MFLRGGQKSIQETIDTYVKPKPGQKILDIGCGIGDLLRFLPQVDYCGFDMDAAYIDHAKKKFGNRGEFFCKKASGDVVSGTELFDTVVIMGVIHHLNDHEAETIFNLVYQVLKPRGRLVMLYDGCYLPDLTLIERLFLALDRGKYIRTEKNYCNLIPPSFSKVTTHIRRDLFWIPYSTIIIECIK